MKLNLSAQHLRRYKDIGWLLVKIGRSDLIEASGLSEAMQEEALEARDGDPEKLASELESMGPAFIKLGQLLSTRADLLSEPYLRSLSRLQDEIEPFAYEKAAEIVESELGVRISKAFSEFQEEPVAAASLGQVHFARLRDGRPVAVKVQRPEVRKQFVADLEIFYDVASYLDKHTDFGQRHRLELVVGDFRRMMLAELDYLKEARHLQRLKPAVEPFGIVVPQPIEDYCSSKVLTMRYVEGRKITDLGPMELLDLEGEKLAEQIFQAYLHQILVDGTFHADPHPGNILVTPEGQLALVDLGMVAHFSEHTQQKLLQLLINLADGRSTEVCELLTEISERLEGFSRQKLQRNITDLMGEYVDASVSTLPVGRLILEVARAASQSGLRLPSELTLLGKTLSNLDEVGRVLAPDFRPDLCVKRNALQIFQKKIQQGLSPANLLSKLIETKDFVEQLPGRINRILDNVGDNKLAVRVEGINEKRLIEGLQKIANRITIGLILAALIVGAAMLMRIETPWQFFGYPALAIVLFLLAAGAGIALLASILYSDRFHR